MARKLRIGLVGAGWAVRGMLPGWRAVADDAEVVAICTTRADTAQAAAERYAIPRSYAGFRAMLSEADLDVVSMGAPPPARYEMTLAALAAGKHVFTCVPFATSAARAREMRDAQEAAGLIGWTDAYFLHAPAFAYLSDLIASGALGELFAVNVDFSMPLFNRMSADYPYRWTGYAKNGASVLRNNGAHAFHTVVGLFGEVDAVAAQIALSVKEWRFEDGSSQTPEAPDTATVMFKLRNGAMGSMHLGRAVPSGPGFRLEAYGSHGRVRAETWHYPYDHSTTLSFAAPIRVGESNSERILPIPQSYFTPIAASDHPLSITMGRLCSHAIEAIRGGAPVQPDFRRSTRVLEIVEAAEQAAAEQVWISTRSDQVKAHA